LRNNFYIFVQRAFATVDPSSPYQHDWHIDAIARALERVASGEMTRLIITMPPRSLKSIATSATFPAWLPDRNPRRRIVTLFPAGQNDDQVDTLSQFLRWFAEPKHKSGSVHFNL